MEKYLNLVNCALSKIVECQEPSSASCNHDSKALKIDFKN